MATCLTHKIDSNVAGLRYAEEECPKELPDSPVWKPLEPNSYSDFGGNISTTARTPITNSRQRQKGSPTDMDVTAGFNMDLTQTNLQDLLQGFMFADTRVKSSYSVTATEDDLVVTISPGNFPTITSTTLDFTTLGLIPGEWIFIGGDTTASKFENVENNGFKRVRSISAKALVLDKSVAPMVAEDGDGLEITIYMGKVLKNEAQPNLIKKRTYALELTLGSLDGLDPPQSEYIFGATPNEATFNLATADKVTVDLGFVAMDFQARTQEEGLLPGTRPALVGADFFNTSSDFKRVKLSTVGSVEEAPSPMFMFLQEGSLTINNNVTANKAIGTLGAFDTSVGDFAVSGSLTAYFSDIRAVQAVRNNEDMTLDIIMVKQGKGHGMVFDMPLITLGDGRPNVVKDEPITLPLTLDATSGSYIDSGLDYTAMWVFFDNLPELASTI